LTDILPDTLDANLRLVVCGSAAGTASARAGAYYAGPGNRFWPILYSTGLTPIRLEPHQFKSVLRYRIGLTDIVKKTSGADRNLLRQDFDPERLKLWIAANQPRVFAFNGKKAAENFFGCKVAYGWQTGQEIGATRFFVAPSTSGAARGFWNEDRWRELADAVRVL
jgi:TDG/mug DNA glycosylase family protein